MEEWREIPGYEGHYEASNLGNIRSMDRKSVSYGTRLCKRKGRIIKQKTDRYLYVDLCKEGVRKTYTTHSLVAKSFLGECPEGKEIDHIDQNKLNNCVTNLRYVTKIENQANRGMSRHNTSGEKYISLLPSGVYRFNSSCKGKTFNKRFKTLEQAKAFRMEHFGF